MQTATRIHGEEKNEVASYCKSYSGEPSHWKADSVRGANN
jgi:hypothetical protein